jgi:hypothetical protein
MCCSSINNYLCAASLNLRVQKKWRGHHQESADADLLLFHFRVSVLHFRRLPGDDAAGHLQSGSDPFPDATQASGSYVCLPGCPPTNQNPAASYRGVAITSRIKLNTHTHTETSPSCSRSRVPFSREGVTSCTPWNTFSVPHHLALAPTFVRYTGPLPSSRENGHARSQVSRWHALPYVNCCSGPPV